MLVDQAPCDGGVGHWLGSAAVNVQAIAREVLFCAKHDHGAIRDVQLDKVVSVLPFLSHDGEENIACGGEAVEASELPRIRL